MFEHRRFGLEQAVIAGTKTMTRRTIKGNFEDVKAYHANGGWHFIADTDEGDSVALKPRYEIGERVAIAQPYKNDDVLIFNAYNEDGTKRKDAFSRHREMLGSEGYRNKMFVRTDFMPHVIEITDIKAERLQDISDEDCLREGVIKGKFNDFPHDMYFPYKECEDSEVCYTARGAFRVLIDRLNGRGTWEKNEWQFAYTFKLIR